MHKILIIEDDPTLNEGIAMILKSPEHQIIRAETIGEARAALKQEPDLILLDINLPDGNGFDFCRQVRQEYDTPIIFLTAEDMELDIVRGLEMGGDDYITKPFSLMVLRARVNSVLRRHQNQGYNVRKANLFQNSRLRLDFDLMRFEKDGEPVVLSRTEQKLLKILVVNQGQVLSKEQLLDKVWETEFVDDHALTVTVKRLRDKLQTKQIKSIYGIGYKWVREDE